MKSNPSSLKTQIRKPRQKRSKARVDAILEASKQLIVEKGSAKLKIQEIAERAGVTAGSMYQYFPNKAAIIYALAEHYMEYVHHFIRAELEQPPETLEECIQTMNLLLDQFFKLYREDAVLREIWVITAGDKNMQDIDIEDSRRNAETLFLQIRYLFPEQHWQRLSHFLFLSMHMCGAIIRLALSVEKDEGEQLIDAAKQMFSAGLMNSLKN